MPNLNADIIRDLETPEKGSKFYGYSGAEAQGLKAPGGFGVVVTAAGTRSFALNYRIAGKERRYTIGRVGVWPVPKAIKTARELRQQIDRGDDPLAARTPVKPPPKEPTVAELFDTWLARRGKAAVHQQGMFRNHITPAIGKIPFRQLRKSDVATMADKIADTAGPVAADRAITYLSAVLNWQASREDVWQPPLLRGLKRTSTAERSRERVLSANEIRMLWPAFGAIGAFGQVCKLLLLTGQRRSDIMELRCQEIDLEGRTATIPAARYKTRTSHQFALSEPAMAILAAIRQRRDDRVFPTVNYGKGKGALEKLAPLPNWTLHDLRRTAASLMFENGVSLDDVDRVLGHVVRGVNRTYVRGDFLAQKRRAADVLAAVIERILSPPAANVVELRQGVQA
jgi:integrase